MFLRRDRAVGGYETRSGAGINHPNDVRSAQFTQGHALTRQMTGAVGGGLQPPCPQSGVICPDRQISDTLRRVEALAAVSEKARLLLVSTAPFLDVLRSLSGLDGGPYGFDRGAQDVTRLAEETCGLAARIAKTAGQLQDLLKGG